MAAAETILEGAASRRIELAEFRDGYFPYQGDEIKSWIENIKTSAIPMSCSRTARTTRTRITGRSRA